MLPSCSGFCEQCLHFLGSDWASPSTVATATRCFAWLRSQLSIAMLACVFASKYAARHTTETRRRQKRDTMEQALNERGGQNLPWHYTFYRHFRSIRIIFFGFADCAGCKRHRVRGARLSPRRPAARFNSRFRVFIWPEHWDRSKGPETDSSNCRSHSNLHPNSPRPSK